MRNFWCRLEASGFGFFGDVARPAEPQIDAVSESDTGQDPQHFVGLGPCAALVVVGGGPPGLKLKITRRDGMATLDLI